MKKRVPAKCKICALLPNCTFLQPDKCEHFRPGTITITPWKAALMAFSSAMGICVGIIVVHSFFLKNILTPAFNYVCLLLPVAWQCIKPHKRIAIARNTSLTL